jgi:hypothetical protein
MSSGDNFFSPEVFNEATAEIMQRRAAPLAKGADGEAWSRQFASDLTASMNSYMTRNYRDLFERLDVLDAAKGVIMVRLENVSTRPVEEVKVDVNGGQLFMEGPVATSRFRSLGTKLLRIPAIKPGEKSEFYILTTQDMSPGGTGPRVQVSSKDQAFPIVVHAQGAPVQPTLKAVGWIAFATLYVALIVAGLGVKALSLTGVRFGLLTPARAAEHVSEQAAPAPAPAFETPAPVPARPAAPPRTETELKAWQGPRSP